MSVVQFPQRKTDAQQYALFTPNQSLIDQDWDSVAEESDALDRAYSIYLKDIER